jgi:phosphoglycerate dehydrogenase-like enzyme
MTAAAERGIRVTRTGYRSTPTIEMTWALILASARHIVLESNSMRQDGWQTSIGRELCGRTLGVLGLGNIGAQVARFPQSCSGSRRRGRGGDIGRQGRAVP